MKQEAKEANLTNQKMTIETSIKNNVKAEDMCITEQTNNDILMLT